MSDSAAPGHVRVQFLGTGGPLASGGRLQTGILIQSDHGCYLVDCGMTALVSMSRFDVDPGAIDAVLITHLHGDHWSSLCSGSPRYRGNPGAVHPREVCKAGPDSPGVVRSWELWTRRALGR